VKLPSGKVAKIPIEKLEDYVLSEKHSTGKFKAKFFRKYGFDAYNVSLFKKSLGNIARSENVKSVQKTTYGTKYLLDGKINTPVGKMITVRTIWIIEKSEKQPRLVTAYPK
jgi:hypothetical protein